MSRDIDIQVAQALGWTVAYNPERGKFELRNPDGVSVIAVDADSGDEGAAQTRWVGVPHYSTDMAAAWTLVEQCYSGDVRRLSNGAEYESYLVVERNGANADGYARADSAAAAICAAFLKLMEGQV